MSCFMDLTLELLQLNSTFLSYVNFLQLFRGVFRIEVLLAFYSFLMALCGLMALRCQHLLLLKCVLHDLCIVVNRTWSDLPFPFL